MPPPLRRPRPLRGGDRVVVVAPSGPVDAGRLARGVGALESLGLGVEIAPHVHDMHDRLEYLAGSDAARARDLAAAWCDPTVAGVVCARGGYGALRMLGELDVDVLAAQPPKAFLGGSDTTSLHLALATRAGVATYFGPMPATALLGGPGGPDAESLAGLRVALFTDEPLTVRAQEAWVVRPGQAEGVTTGGTLSLLAAALGSTDLRSAAGCIAVLEDVAEAPYRVDRMLTSLLRSGWFDGVAGVALGSWEDCGPGVSDVLAERLAPLGVPVLGGLPVGHGRPQLTIQLGAPAVLDADAGTLMTAAPPGRT